MFSLTWIAFGIAKNGNTLATGKKAQEMVKLLLEVFFATMLARKLSRMRWQCFRMFPPHSDCLQHCPKCRKIGKKSGKEFIPDVVLGPGSIGPACGQFSFGICLCSVGRVS